MDLKIKDLKETHVCDLTADKGRLRFRFWIQTIFRTVSFSNNKIFFTKFCLFNVSSSIIIQNAGLLFTNYDFLFLMLIRIQNPVP
jgi:hypothetical protein